MYRSLRVLCIACLSMLVAGCGSGGGNGSGSGGSQTLPSSGFAIALSSGSVTLAQGGISQSVQVSITSQSGFNGTVAVTATGVPPGVTISPASLNIAAGASGSFTFTASGLAGIALQSAQIEGISGSNKADSVLQISVTGAAVPDPFHLVGGELVHGFYDPGRQLLFLTNPALNELDVISGTDLSLRARIPAPQAWGIDQMADNKTLVIGTSAQDILTVDEDTFVVSQHPVTGIGRTILGLFYPNVIAMANGKVLMIGQEQGIDSSDIAEGGQFLVEWDSVADTFSILEPNGQLGWETDRLARSADHKWAVFSADQFYLYSSDADSLTTVPLSTVNPPLNEFGVRGYAVNADGTKIGVASADQVTFLDRSLNVLGTTQIPSAFQTARSNVVFNADGSKLLLQYALPTAIEVVNANQFSADGYYSGDVAPADNLARMVATDLSGHAFIGTTSGFRVVDMNQPPIPNDPNNPTLAGAPCPIPQVDRLSLNSSAAIPISARPGTSYYVGGQPAPLLANGSQIQIPASSIPGPVDIECVGPDGNTFVIALGFSYGVKVNAVSANLLPPIGNPVVTLSGFGFTNSSSTLPSVTIGGQSALVVDAFNELDFGSFQIADVKVPTKGAGQSADIMVSSANGTGTLTQAVSYIPSTTIIPATGLLQILYDSHRNLLYGLKAAELDIFNPATLQFQATFPLTGLTGTGNYNTMALSPDGSHLIAVSANGYAAVLDPGNPGAASVVAIPVNSGFQSGSVAVTKFNKALITDSEAVEVDLSTLAVRSLGSSLGDLVRASADGSFLYGMDLNVTSGAVRTIDTATYATQSIQFGFLFWTDLAVAGDGRFAAIDGSPDAGGDITGFFDSNLHLLNFNAYPFSSQPDDVQVLGSTFSPQGTVLVVPLGDSIEFWDANKGTLRARLMTPEELQFFAFPEGPVAPRIALDSAGQTIFALSQTGLTVMEMPEPLDTLPAQAWPLSVHNGAAQANPSVGLSSRIAAMRTVKKSEAGRSH